MVMKLSALFVLLLSIRLSAVEAQATKPPLPPHDVITAENVSDIVPLMRLGRGRFSTPVYWTKDGNNFIVGGTLGIWVYDAQNPTAEPRLFDTHSTNIEELHLSSDEKLVIVSFCNHMSEQYVCGESVIQFWEIKTGIMTNEIKIDSRIGNITLSADQSKLAYIASELDLSATSDQYKYPKYIEKIYLMDAASHEELPFAYKGKVSRLIPSVKPDEILEMAKTEDGVLQLWNLMTGKHIADLGDFKGDIRYAILDISPDGKVMAASEGDGTNVRVWDIETGQALGNIQWTAPTNNDIPVSVNAFAFSQDGSKLAISEDLDRVEIWSMSNFKPEKAFTKDYSWRPSIDWSPNNQQMITADDYSLHLWDIDGGALRLVLDEGHRQEPTSVAFSPDGIHLVSGGGSVILWDIQSGKELRIFQSPTGGGYTSAIAYSPDGQLITATGEFTPGDGEDGGCECDVSVLNMWNAVTGDLAGRIFGWGGQGGNELGEAAFSPDGKYITIANPPTVWSTEHILKSDHVDVDKGEEIHKLFVDYEQGKKVDYSVDGKTVAISNTNGAIQFWDATTGIKQKSLNLGNGSIWDIAYSPDGRLFAASTSHIKTPEASETPPEYDNHIVKIWNVKTDQVVMELNGQLQAISAIAFSPDGKLLVSGSDDGSTRIWDVATGKQVGLLQVNDQVIWDVAFSPDVKLIATASRDGTVRLWGVPTN